MGVKEIFCVILTAIVIPVAIAELSAWAPKISARLVRVAARCLPVEDQERYEEEWLAHIDEVPAPFSKLITAFSMVPAGVVIGIERRREARRSAKIPRRQTTTEALAADHAIERAAMAAADAVLRQLYADRRRIRARRQEFEMDIAGAHSAARNVLGAVIRNLVRFF